MRILILTFILLLTACTKNDQVKNFGGTSILQLEKNQRLVNVTWKESNLWVLTTEMENGYVPKQYNFTEKSTYGILEGKYIIIETK